MTMMIGKIRAELTQLLADHLNEQHCIRIIQGREYVTSADHFKNVAVDAMDFIYGGEDEHLSKPEQPEVEAVPASGDQGDLCGASCCDGFTCRCCPGGVDRLEGGPVSQGDVVYGVMTQEPLRAPFVYLARPSRPEEFVRLRESDFGQTPPSPQGSGSADA